MMIDRKDGKDNASKSNRHFVVPILMYHHVSPAIKSSISVDPFLFRDQLEALREAGWLTMTASSIFRYLNVGQAPPPNTVLLTFDDAYENFYEHALPVLEATQSVASVYVVTDYIGRYDWWNHKAMLLSRHMNTAQLRDLLALGNDVGCHSRTHQCLVKLPDRQLRSEILGAKAKLEDALNVECRSFCYPYGKYDRRVRDIVNTHFDVSFAVEQGTQDWGVDRWSICRIFVGPKHSPSTVVEKVTAYAARCTNDLDPPKDLDKLIG